MHNREWYKENSNEFLLNLNYPCKLQTDFLKAVELSQQRRNDQKYKKILEQMDAMEAIKESADCDDKKRQEIQQQI